MRRICDEGLLVDVVDHGGLRIVVPRGIGSVGGDPLRGRVPVSIGWVRAQPAGEHDVALRLHRTGAPHVQVDVWCTEAQLPMSVAADVVSGVHTIEIQARTSANIGVSSANGSLAGAEAFIGAGSATIEEVRMIQGNTGETLSID